VATATARRAKAAGTRRQRCRRAGPDLPGSGVGIRGAGGAAFDGRDGPRQEARPVRAPAAPTVAQPQNRPRRCFSLRLRAGIASRFNGSRRFAVAAGNRRVLQRWGRTVRGFAGGRGRSRRPPPAASAAVRHVAVRPHLRFRTVGAGRRRPALRRRRRLRRCVGHGRRIIWLALLDGAALAGFGRVHDPVLDAIA
jgi:hypothetical protein